MERSRVWRLTSRFGWHKSFRSGGGEIKIESFYPINTSVFLSLSFYSYRRNLIILWFILFFFSNLIYTYDLRVFQWSAANDRRNSIKRFRRFSFFFREKTKLAGIISKSSIFTVCVLAHVCEHIFNNDSYYHYYYYHTHARLNVILCCVTYDVYTCYLHA